MPCILYNRMPCGLVRIQDLGPCPGDIEDRREECLGRSLCKGRQLFPLRARRKVVYAYSGAGGLWMRVYIFHPIPWPQPKDTQKFKWPGFQNNQNKILQTPRPLTVFEEFWLPSVPTSELNPPKCSYKGSASTLGKTSPWEFLIILLQMEPVSRSDCGKEGGRKWLGKSTPVRS